MALHYFRRHRRWLYAFLWIVILGFIVFYIPAFRSVDAGSPGETLGSVGGASISAAEFQRAYLQRRQLYERLYQGRIDPAMMKSLGIEEQVFEGLVAEKLIESEARRLGVHVSDEELAKSITSAPDLQENGQFIGAPELKRRLNLGGQTVAAFEAQRRERLVAEKLAAIVTAAVSVGDDEVEREFRRRNEQVKLEYVLADAGRFRADAQATDDEIQARFSSRKESYKLPERRIVSFLLVDPQALKSRVSVTDRDIESHYLERKDEFREEEQACASHILVKVKTSPDAKEGHPAEEAKQLAQALLDRVKAGGDLAAIAKKESEDKGSAPGGGELGCFGRGRMLPEFEGAVFALNAGEIAPEIVKTSAGYHVIRLDSKREETFQPLAQVKERIRQTLTLQRTRALAEDQSRALGTALGKGASLEDAGKAQGLTAQKSQPLTRGAANAAPLGSPALVARAFDLKPNEIEKGPFALPSGGFAFIALGEVLPAQIPPLADVKDKVKSDILEEKALERARLLANDVRIRSEKLGLEKAALALALVRKETPGLVGRGQPLGDLGQGAAVEEAAFGIDEKTLSEPVRTASGYAVLRVLEKKRFDPAAFEKEKAEIQASLRETKRNQFFQTFLSAARQRVTVDRNGEVFRRLVG